MNLYKWVAELGVWVLVGSYTDKAQALAKQAELDKQGIETILLKAD